MAARRPVDPRRKPVQQRAQETVDVILKATAQVLVKEGYDKATTNRIAAAAGVSIGTLYQYFPNKESLVVALSRRHTDEMMKLLSGMIVDLRDAPPRQATRALIKAMCDAHAVDPALHKVLVEHLPQATFFERIHDVGHKAHQIVRHYLEAHRERIIPQDLDMAAFLVVTTVEATTHAAVLQRQDMLLNDDLVDQITRLVHQYLFVADPS